MTLHYSRFSASSRCKENRKGKVGVQVRRLVPTFYCIDQKAKGLILVDTMARCFFVTVLLLSAKRIQVRGRAAREDSENSYTKF